VIEVEAEPEERLGYSRLFGLRPGGGHHPSPAPGTRPFQLDSKTSSIPVRDFELAELRFSTLADSDPDHSRHLLALAQAAVDERWHYHEQLAGETRSVPHDEGDDATDDGGVS